MKKPFAFIGLGMILSLVFAAAFHTAAPYCAAVCFVLFVLFIILKKKFHKKTGIYALCAAAMCVSMLSHAVTIDKYVTPITEKYDGMTASFSGIIVTEPYTSYSTTSFTIVTNEINGEKKKLKIRISTSQAENAEIYDKIEATATLSSLFDETEGFSSYYAARNIFLSTYINPYFGSKYKITKNENRPFYAVIADERKAVALWFHRYLSYNEASVCTAVVTGDRQYLSDSVYDNFKKLGISHILVVSGMHLSVISGAVRLIARRIFKKREISTAIELVFIWSFSLLTGMGFSVIRAAIMLTVSTLAWAMNDKADGLNSLGFAAIILYLNPLNIGDIGLLWSFACTFSILSFTDPIEKCIKNIVQKNLQIKSVISAASVSAAAAIGSLPFLIFYTGAISPYMIAINILIMPFTGIMLVTALTGAVLTLLNLAFAAKPFMLIAGLSAKLFINITEWFESLPFSNIKTDNNKVYILFFISVILTVCFYSMDKKHLKYVTVVSVLLLSLIHAVDIVTSFDTVTLSVQDVGNGLAVTVAKNGNISLLDACGEKYQYRQYKNELNDFDSISCVFDTNYAKFEDYTYYRRILHDYNADKIIVSTDYKKKYTYAYSQYIGSEVTYSDTNISVTEIADSLSVTIIRTTCGVWQYVRIYDKDILICPCGADYGLLPYPYKNCDYLVMSEVPHNMVVTGNQIVLASAYGDECNKILSEMKNAHAVYVTNGKGRLDIKYNGKGNVSVSQKYTGGVKRYASGE